MFWCPLPDNETVFAFSLRNTCFVVIMIDLDGQQTGRDHLPYGSKRGDSFWRCRGKWQERFHVYLDEIESLKKIVAQIQKQLAG